MPRPVKLTEDKIIEIRRDWEMFPDWTIEQLSIVHKISITSIKRAVKGLSRNRRNVGKTVSLQSLEGGGVQIDTEGNVYGLHKPFFYAPLDLLPKQKEPETYKVVCCPEKDCNYRGIARNLLRHLLDKHARYDLQYLLDT